jgi:hypothetical protein
LQIKAGRAKEKGILSRACRAEATRRVEVEHEDGSEGGKDAKGRIQIFVQ